MSPASRSSKDYFDAIGAGWDRLREGFFPDRIREQALAVAGVQEGQVAVDLGAGTGFLTQGLLERGLRVIAVDQSPPMLDALRAKFPGAEGLDCRVGDAEKLPISEGSVHHCLANMFLHHVERPPAAIREMVRILRPGGRVVLTDLDRHDFWFMKEEYHDRWMGFERSDIETWFRQAGLTGVTVDDLDARCCSEADGGEEASTSIFIASGTSLDPGSPGRGSAAGSGSSQKRSESRLLRC